jgi:hypothetical protein
MDFKGLMEAGIKLKQSQNTPMKAQGERMYSALPLGKNTPGTHVDRTYT